jgi:site-specific DNA-methyltransferase (adenine-specific)
MGDGTAEVLSGERRWHCEQADALEFLRSLPDDSVDLLFTSPPYESARTYSLGSPLPAGEEWVRWMVEIVTAARPKVKGLIAVNCEGQTRGYSYSAVPFLLIADLKRAGFNLRKPCVYERDGIPGSGGPDWLKNRWEPIVCVTRPGRLPWSDNTACGHKPKYGAGGRVSHRAADGVRKAFAVQTRRRQDGSRQVATEMDRGRPAPDLSNPGNVIDCGADTHLGLGNLNEAPFPLKLAEFFILPFCPPNGIVCDPFSGSGTTCHAATMHGRRFVGCDVRESQVELCRRRLASVTPNLFSEV